MWVTTGWIRTGPRSFVHLLTLAVLFGTISSQVPAQQPQPQFQQQPTQFGQQQQQQAPFQQQPAQFAQQQQQAPFQQQQAQFQQQQAQQQPAQFQQRPAQPQQQRFPVSGGVGPGQFPPFSGPQNPASNGSLPLAKPLLFQLSSNINLGTNVMGSLRVSTFSRYQIWFLTAKILAKVDDRSRADYVVLLQPPLQKGIPAYNISQVILSSSVLPNPEVLNILIEQVPGMLVSQQAVIVQRIRMRIGEPAILRTIMATESPAELFSYLNPPLLARSMGTILKTIGEMPDPSRTGLKAVRTKLLPRNFLSAWLSFVRKSANVPRWTAEDLAGLSPFGAAHQLNLAILGLGCGDLALVPTQDILPVLARFRQELYELRKFQKNLGFPVDLRNCALGKVVEFLKPRNQSALPGQLNILSGLRPGEIPAIGGEILTATPLPALENIPPGIRVEILEEIGRLETLELFRLAPLDQLLWYGNRLLSDLSAPRAPQALGPLPGTQPLQLGSGSASLNLDSQGLRRMGNLLCYANNMRNLSREALETRLGQGDKTCCLDSGNMAKWAGRLKGTFGPDPGSWTSMDLVTVGDLLVTLSIPELEQLGTDAVARAVSPILKQSGFNTPLDIIGQDRPVAFITACVKALGPTEGPAYLNSYKALMRRLVQGAQNMVKSIKTVDQVISDGMGRPRVKRGGGQSPRFHYPEPAWRQSRSQGPYPYPPRVRRQVGPPVAPTPIPTGLNPTAPRPAPGSPPVRMVLVSGTRPTAQPPPTLARPAPPAMRLVQAPAPDSSQRQPMIMATKAPPVTQAQRPVPMTQLQGPPRAPAPMMIAVPITQPVVQQPEPKTRPPVLQRPPPSLNTPPRNDPNIQKQVVINPAFQNPSSQAQRPTFQGQNPNFQTQNPSFQSQNPNSQGQNPNFQTQNPNSQGQNPNFQTQNPAFQGQNANPGFQPPSFPQGPQSGSQDPRSTAQVPPVESRGPSDKNETSSGNAASNDERARSLQPDADSDASHVNFTCLGIKAAGPAAIGLTLTDLHDLPAEELFDCIETFGNIDWEEGMKRSLLRLYKEKLNLTTDQVDTLNLIELGSLVTAFSSTNKGRAEGKSLFDAFESLVETTDGAPVEKSGGHEAFDISAIDLTLPTSLDALSILGIQVTDPDMLKSIADKFNEDNKMFPGRGKGSSTRPDHLRVTLWSFGNIICGFEEPEIRRIFEADRSLFIDVSPMLGRIQGCDHEVLATLASFAVQPANYGPPSSWSREDVNTVGVVAAGLSPELFSSLTPEGLSGLTPSAVRLIPTASLQSLSLDQLSNLSYEAAAAIQPAHVEVLSQDQIGALNRVLSVSGDDFSIPPVSSTVLELPTTEPQQPRSLGNETEEAVSGRAGSGDDYVFVVPDQDGTEPGARDEETRSIHSNHSITANQTTTAANQTTTAANQTTTAANQTTPAPVIITSPVTSTTTPPPPVETAPADPPARETAAPSGARVSSSTQAFVYSVTLITMTQLTFLS